MFIVRNLSYKINHSIDIFENLSFTIGENEKVAIIGKNGIGKSILLKLLVGEIVASNGEIIKNGVNISYFPQKFNELNFSSVADVFGLEKQVISLKKVDDGVADIEDYENLDGNWDCIDKIKEKMKFFNLNFDLLRDFKTLSGGEKVKLILSSIIDENSNFLILDEPTNNMDYNSKKYFYEFIKNWRGGLMVVSHDRELLNLVNKIFELRKIGMKETKLFVYGGNYDYWKQQKELETQALENQYNNSIKQIKHAKQELQNEREMKDRKRKEGERMYGLERRSSGRQAGLIVMTAESKRGQLARQHNNRVERSESKIQDLTSKLEISNKIYFKFNENTFKNKNLVEIENLLFFYGKKQIFNDFNLLIKNGDRIAINGKNGSGKTTLLNIIMGKITDFKGSVRINTNKIVYLDQNCDFLNQNLTILENILNFNNTIKEKDARDILAMFLFRTDDVYKKVQDLSGGEKLRVALACIFSNDTPELILLDEPTNNMDLESIEVLENILNQYNGGLVVVSHDEVFKENIGASSNVKL